MATSPVSDTERDEEPEAAGDASVDFTDEEIAESLEPFFAEVDADYEKAFGPIVEEFRTKGPPDAEDEAALTEFEENAKEHDSKSEPDPTAKLKSEPDEEPGQKRPQENSPST